MTVESVDTVPETVNTAEEISTTKSRTPNTLLSLPQEIRDQILRQLLSASCVYEANATTQKYTFHPTVLRVCRQTYREGKKILYGRGENLFVILKFNGPFAWKYSGVFKAVPAIWSQYFEKLPEAAIAIGIRNIDDRPTHPSFNDSTTMITAIQSVEAIVECFWQIGIAPWNLSAYDYDLQKMWVSFDFNPTILSRRTPLQLSLLAKLGSFAGIGRLVVNYRHGHYEGSVAGHSTSPPDLHPGMGPEDEDSVEVVGNDTESLLTSDLPIREQAADFVAPVYGAIENLPGSASESSGQEKNFADFIYEAIQSPPTLASYLGLTEEMFGEGNDALESGRCHEAIHKYQAIISYSKFIRNVCDSWVLPFDDVSEKRTLCEAVFGETGSEHSIENAKIGIAKSFIHLCKYHEALEVLSVFPWPPLNSCMGVKFQLLYATACFSLEAFTPGKEVFHELQSLILDPFDHKFDIIVDIIRELAWAWDSDESWGLTSRSIGPVEPWLARLLDHCWKLLDALEQEEQSAQHVGLADEAESEY
ncbi:hypothetical protein MMC17_003114 [Xylographa soralifera]|nr:hypothetical protein [Xylographa soralifera]